MEYYSSLKKNEIMSFAGKWMELGKTVLIDGTETQKDKCCTVSLFEGYELQTFIGEYIGHSNHRDQETAWLPGGGAWGAIEYGRAVYTGSDTRNGRGELL